MVQDDDKNNISVKSGRLSIRHGRRITQYFLNGSPISKKKFFAILAGNNSANEWVKLYKMLSWFAALLGVFGTAFLTIAVLLKIKGLTSLALVQLLFSIIQYAVAAILSIRSTRALDKALDIYNGES